MPVSINRWICIVAFGAALFAGFGCANMGPQPGRREIKAALESPISLTEAERSIFRSYLNLPADEAALLAQHNESFRPGWMRFVANLRHGDELWSYRHYAGGPCSERGFAIVRNGKVASWYKHLLVYEGAK